MFNTVWWGLDSVTLTDTQPSEEKKTSLIKTQMTPYTDFHKEKTHIASKPVFLYLLTIFHNSIWSTTAYWHIFSMYCQYNPIRPV